VERIRAASDEPTFRPATSGDIQGIQTLYIQGDVYHSGILPDVFRRGSRGRPNELILSWIEDERSDYLVALLRERIVGFLNLRESSRPDYPIFLPRRFAEIENLVVDRDHRRKGVGSLLLGAAKRWAVERGLESIQLNVWAANGPALRFYDGSGFETILNRMELRLR
jgi:ribosomal protein S18 acetylase RimI-like enzyme